MSMKGVMFKKWRIQVKQTPNILLACLQYNEKKIIKKARRISDDTGKLLVNEIEINNEIESYFKVLLNPKTPHDFDQDLQAWIESEILNNVPQNLMEGNAQTKVYKVNDIEKIVKNLKERKAPGRDQIDPEYWKFGDKMVYQLITVVI